MGYFDDLPPISGEAPPPAPPPPALQNTDDEPKHGGYFDGLSPITPPADIASRALTQAAQDGQSPDQAATAMKVADDLGVGLPAVQGNLPDYQAQAEVKANQALLRDNPQLAHWLGRNPQAAPLVRDDMQSMANLDSSLIAMAAVAAGPLTPTLVAGAALFEPDAVKAGAEEAYITNQRGRTGVQLQAANLGLPGDKAAIEAEIAGYNRQLGAIPVSDSAGAAAVRNVTSFVVGYLDNAVKGGLPAGLGGAAVGAGVGAAAGGVGAVPGAVIGGTTAFGTGTMADMAEVATGNAYLNLKGMTSKDGQPMSEGAAQVGALATGIFTYVIGSKFNALEAKILGITPEIMAQRAVAKALQEQTTASIIRDATTGVVKSALSGGAMMGTMEAGTILAEEAAKLMSPGEYDHDPAQMAERVFQATMNGVFMIGLTHGAMKGIGLFGDMRSADTADQLGKALTDVMNGTEATKLHSRSAMAMRSFLQSYTNGGPVEDMRIPDSVIRNFYAKTGIKPGEENDPFKFVDDMQQQMTDAQNVGGADIVMKTADFVNNFAGTEFAKELIPDVRIGANAMTMREAAEFEKEYQERVKDAMSEAGNKEAELTPQDQTYHEIFKNLSEQGVPIEQARYVATVAASRYNARAERFNEGMAEAGPYKPTDAYQEFKRSGLVFQRAAGPSEGGMLQTAWHGSPHEHEGFANDAIGTGQGAASYGFGHYVAENPTVSREYQRELARHSIYVGGAEHKRIDIDPAAEATPEAIRQENIDSLHHEMVDGDLRVRAGEAIKRHAQTLVDRIKSLQMQKERAQKLVGAARNIHPEIDVAYKEGQKFYDEELRVAKASLDDLRDIASKGIEIKAQSYHYKVDVPDELVAKMLLHDKPLAEQPEAVRNLVTQHPELFGEPHPWAVLGSNAPADEGTKGYELYDRLARSMEVQHGEQRDGGQRLASEWLEQHGVPGIKYLDEGSRFLPPHRTPTHNLVVFNGNNIKLLERENAEGEKRFFQSILSPDAPARQPPNSPGALPARIPTGKGAEQPLDNILASSLSAARADPKHLEKIVNAVAQQPGMEGARRIRGVEAKLQWILNKMRDNILAIHDAMDAQVRERAKLWYQGGRNISERLGQRWGKTTEQVAGMIATLSPQKDWFMNTSMAERLGDIMHTQMDHVWDKDMHAAAFSYLLPDVLKPEDRQKVRTAFEVAHGKSLREVLATGNQTAVGVWLRAYDEAHHSSAYSVISPEGDFNDTVKTQKGKEAGNAWQSFEAIGAAASIFMDGSRENISEQLGNNHKVRNFYNNILNPHDPRFTTVDTHATAVAHLSPMSSKDQAVNNVFSGSGSAATGFKGTYPIYQEAYEQAAAMRSMLPREMQSITWEGVRGMFGEKSDEMRADVQKIHNMVAKGELTDEQGRFQILLRTGMEDPAWFQREGQQVLKDMTYRTQRDAFTGTRIAFEVAPDPTGDPELYARWRALPDVVRADISHRVAWRTALEAMATTWRTAEGKPAIVNGELHTQIGGYLQDTNPSMSIRLDENVSGKRSEELTRLLGYALRQNEMAATSPPTFNAKGERRPPPKGWEHKGLFEVHLGGPKSPEEVRQIYDQLRAADPRISGHTTDSNGVMGILVDKGLEEEMARKADETLGGRYNTESVSDGLDVYWPSKGKDDYGLSRQSEESKSGSPLREQADLLREHATAQLNAELDRAESGVGRTAQSPLGTEHAVQPQRGPLRQENEGQPPRGEINLRDGHAIVNLFKAADASTPIHELGHLWFEELMSDAKRPDAPQQIKDDLQTILKWLGVESPEQVDVVHHEQLARGFERYLMEGKAPSTALARAFSRFKGWLTQIYKNLTALDAPISDDVRRVFDRLVATDAEIAEAQEYSGLTPLFESAKDAGMTKAEYSAYLKQVSGAKAAAEGKLLDKAMASIRRQRTAAYKSQAAQYRSEAAEQIDARPDVNAWNTLKSKDGLGGEKVSRETVEVNYPDLLDKLPSGILKGRPDGIHVDHAAELLGYDNGRELLEALANLQKQQDDLHASGGKGDIRDHLIDQQVEQKMAGSDTMDEQSMMEEARAAVHSEQQQELMATELRFLKRSASAQLVKTGQVRKEAAAKLSDAEQKLADAKMTERWDAAEERAQQARMKLAVQVTKDMLDGMRRNAADILGNKRVSDASIPSTYLRDERAAARDVQKALLAGDAAGAAAAKQRQLLSSILYTEASRNRDAVDSLNQAMKNTAAKATIKSWDQGVLDQMHSFLSQWGYKVKRDPGELDRGLKRAGGVLDQDGNVDRAASFDKWVQEQFDAGRSLPIETWMSRGGDLQALKFSEFQKLGDLFTAMRTLARNDQTVMAEGKAVERDVAVAELTSALSSRFDQKEGSEFATEDMRKATEQRMTELAAFLRSMNASLLKKEQLFDWWGGEGRDNPFERYIMRPLRDAQFRKNQMTEDVNRRLDAVRSSLGKGWADHLRDIIGDHDLKAPGGKQMKIDRKAMLKIALNWGTEDNATKLTRGYDWDSADVQNLLDKHMTADDWKFVRGVWDIYDAYKEPLDDLQRRVNGIGLKMVEGRTVQTLDGPIEGKYFPLDYDRTRSSKADKLGQKSTDEALFDRFNYYRPETPNGSVHERVSGVNMPVDLSLDTALRRLGQTVHDLAFREAIIQADKLLEDPKVAGMIESTWGREYQKLFRPWLKAIANSASVEEDAVGWFNKLLRGARTNSVIVGIGFRLSTVLKHGSGAAINSQAELGHWFERGVAEAYFNPWAKNSAWNWALETSKEVKYRLNQYDRDTQQQLMETIGGVSHIDAFKNLMVHYSHMPVAALDFGSAVPTFIGAYRRAQAKGLSHEDAVYEADKVVRQAHGSQTPLDQAAFQQSNDEATKLVGAFYGYFNHVYNRQADTIMKAKAIPGQIGEGDISGASRNFMLVLMRTLGYVAAPALSAAWVSSGGPDQDKGEGWWGWAAKAIASELPAGIPVVRDIAKAAIEGRDYELSPLASMVNELLKTGTDAHRFLDQVAGFPDGKKVSTSWIKHASDSFGYFTGLPTGQAGAAAQFLWDYEHGEEDPRDIADWVRGLAKGTLKKPKGE